MRGFLLELAVVTAAFALVACAGTSDRTPSVGEPPSYRKLELFTSIGDPAKRNDAFATEVEKVFGTSGGSKAIQAALEDQGFACMSVPPVEARTDYLVLSCDMVDNTRPCIESWNVALRFNNFSRALDSTRVRAIGSFTANCPVASPPKAN